MVQPNMGHIPTDTIVRLQFYMIPPRLKINLSKILALCGELPTILKRLNFNLTVV
jgi:hypothetical protein